MGRSAHIMPFCYHCGEEGHTTNGCPNYGGGVFQGECYFCGQWGHQARLCTAQQAHVSTDEYERAEDGYPFNQYSDYYDVYNEEHEDGEVKSQQGLYSLMVRVLGVATLKRG